MSLLPQNLILFFWLLICQARSQIRAYAVRKMDMVRAKLRWSWKRFSLLVVVSMVAYAGLLSSINAASSNHGGHQTEQQPTTGIKNGMLQRPSRGWGRWPRANNLQDLAKQLRRRLVVDDPYVNGGGGGGGGGNGDHVQEARVLAASMWEHTQSAIAQSTKKPTGHLNKNRIFYAVDNGADPSGGTDSTTAIQNTINQAFEVSSTHSLMTGVVDLGGAEVHLGGGQYVISKPLTIPDVGGGNVIIHGGTLRASSSFPSDGFLIELASSDLRDEWDRLKGKMAQSQALPAFENIVLRNLMLDANYSGGGILLLNPLRTTIENCYITHFSTVGISVQGGHETIIHSSFLGQHITSGSDPNERNFSGTGIILAGNDNAVTDVIIFSAAIGIEIKGQANMITGVHCYNKAAGFGGVGIILRQGADQTRLLSCYMDFTGVVLEESRQISITNSFFLGDAYVLLRAIPRGTSPSVDGLTITNNMFCGSGKGVPIMQLDGNFSSIIQSFVDGNSARGMVLRSTRARATTVGFGTNWTVDLSQTLLFSNPPAHVQYSFFSSSTMNRNAPFNNSATNSFPQHALQSITHNVVTVVSNIPTYATIAVSIDQSLYGGTDKSATHLYQ